MKKITIGILVGMCIMPAISFASEGYLEPIRIIARSSESIAASLKRIENHLSKMEKCK